MLTYTTQLIIKYAKDKFDIDLNKWQIDTVENITSTLSNRCVIDSDRAVGKSTLINILASFYATVANKKTLVLYRSESIKRASQSNIAYTSLNNITRLNVKAYNSSFIGHNYNLALLDEFDDDCKLLIIESDLAIVMYTP